MGILEGAGREADPARGSEYVSGNKYADGIGGEGRKLDDRYVTEKGAPANLQLCLGWMWWEGRMNYRGQEG